MEGYVKVLVPYGISITKDEDGNPVFTQHEEPQVMWIRKIEKA